jgi:hypothetical protein
MFYECSGRMFGASKDLPAEPYLSNSGATDAADQPKCRGFGCAMDLWPLSAHGVCLTRDRGHMKRSFFISAIHREGRTPKCGK